MRFRSLLLASPVLFLAGCTETAFVQSPPPPPSEPVYAADAPPPLPPPDAGPALSPIDQLCAPIALYPDPLISLLLPAATFPDQIQTAANYLQGGGDPGSVDQMPWDPSVRGLSHYATVLEWMAANRDWTSQLGGAFASQPAAVMDAIQELRRKAQAVGALADTPQQRIVVDQNMVEIVPAQPNVIYVPQYDPAVVYVQQPSGYNRAVFFGWSRPYASGVWLSYDFDWHRHAVYTGDWYHYRQINGWRRPVDYAHVEVDGRFHSRGWAPPRNAPPPPPQLGAHRGSERSDRRDSRFAQPRPIAGAPPPPANAVRVRTLEQNRPTRQPAQQQQSPQRPQPKAQPLQQPLAQPRQPQTIRPANQLHPLNDPRRPAQPQKDQEPRKLKPLVRPLNPLPNAHHQPQPQQPSRSAQPGQPQANPAQHTRPQPQQQRPNQHPQPPQPKKAEQKKPETKQPPPQKPAPNKAPEEHEHNPAPEDRRPESN